MTFLSYDVETTSLPHWNKPLDDPAQPRMVQLGAVMADREFNETSCIKLLISPDGWSIPEEVTKIHGITTEHAQAYGIPIKAALIVFMEFVKRSPVHVAHNHAFDAFIIRSEIARLGSDDRGLDRPGIRVVDSMKTGATLMPDGRWPKLQALHEHLLGWAFPDSHDGLQDSRACLRCLRVLIERKLIEL
jgi:DNA polymerase-3 subunit epsilon